MVRFESELNQQRALELSDGGEMPTDRLLQSGFCSELTFQL